MKADKTKVLRLMKTARGQLDGIIKMMEDDRYCIDISNQLLATEGLLHKVNKEVLSAHMKSCLVEAAKNGTEEQMVDELMNIIDKL